MSDMTTITTDVYPTRYAAFDNPGKWVVFTPTDGKCRPAREDAAYMPVEMLGACSTYPGEAAVFADGSTYIEIWGRSLPAPPTDRKRKPDWGTSARDGWFFVDCQMGYAVRTGWERSLADALRTAEDWLVEKPAREVV